MPARAVRSRRTRTSALDCMMRLETPFLRLPKRYCAATIAAEVAALGPSAWVPHPGRLAGNDAIPLITPGGQITNAFAGPMGPTPHLGRCSYIREIMADLGAVWGRSRLMGLAPGSDVPPHVDINYYWRTHLRLHIPVVTTPKVLFTCGDETVHMAAGECWLFDSFRMHNVRNGGTEKRIHLVLDTVGGEGLWDLIEQASRAAADAAALPPPLPPGQVGTAGLAFEQVNTPSVMSPWEVRCHVDFLLRQAIPAPTLSAIAARLERFANGWASAWAQFGAVEAGLPTYRGLIDRIQGDLTRLGAGNMLLPNQVPLNRALAELIFNVAVPPPRLQQAAIAAIGLQSLSGRR